MKQDQNHRQEKKKRGRPKKEKSVSCESAGEDLIASLIQESQSPKEEKKEEELIAESLSDDEEEESVVKFEVNGKTYLKSEDDVLYDLESHEAVGIWNEETNEIDEIPEEEDQEFIVFLKLIKLKYFFCI